MAGCWQERYALFTSQQGGHLLSYGYDMDNFEVYLDWFKTLKILSKETVIFYTNVHERASGNHITNFRSHKIVTGAVLHFHLAPSRTFA